MAIYIGMLVVDPPIEAKLREKHQISGNDVREALQWPAQIRAAAELHEVHGLRWIAMGSVASGRSVIAALLPVPTWAGENADTWVVKTARWL